MFGMSNFFRLSRRGEQRRIERLLVDLRHLEQDLSVLDDLSRKDIRAELRSPIVAASGAASTIGLPLGGRMNDPDRVGTGVDHRAVVVGHLTCSHCVTSDRLLPARRRHGGVRRRLQLRQLELVAGMADTRARQRIFCAVIMISIF